MSERKIDYFGTFLDSMRSREAGAKSDMRTPPQADVDAVLRALKGGERSAKELIPLAGNSISAFLAISEQLINLGWIARRDADDFELTPKGREIAEVLD